jgi:ABC-2 type transport system permease protein
MPFGALSTALALKIRKQESVLGAVNFVLLPLTFMSPAFIAGGLMPTWMQSIAIFNPVGWGVDAGRGALQAEAAWPVVLVRLGYLALFTAVSCWLAMKAFRSYQRTA